MKPEILAPAGDFEKLRTAIHYGADAVYLAGQQFGLRANAKNFSMDDIEKAIEYAHARNVKVYVVANIFANNSDFYGMEEYFKKLYEIKADAVIIADPGVFTICKEIVPELEVHISTQANVTNFKAVNFWYKQGAKRVILARELVFDEIKEISANKIDGVDVEIFVHGAICMAYSGRCMISNYTSGRDSNKGVCDHSCRHKFYLVEEENLHRKITIEEDDKGTFFFNAKDLSLVERIPQIIESGVNSLKIEGRMKSPYYVGVVTKIYREALDDYFNSPELYQSKVKYYKDELEKISHRQYHTGFFDEVPFNDAQNYEENSYISTYSFVGIVKHYDEETKIATVEQRNKFSLNEQIEVFTKTELHFITVDNMYDEEMNAIETAPHAQQVVKMKLDFKVQENDFLRRKI